MKLRIERALVLGAFASLAAMSQAQAGGTFFEGPSTLSALHSTSNLSNSESNFRFDLFHDASENDVYINAVDYNYGTWDFGLGFDTNFEGLNNYTFGTALTGSFFQQFSVARRFGDVDGAVANGFYDFSVDIIGGDTDTSTDNLLHMDLTLEVADVLDISASGVLDNLVVPQVSTTTLTMTVMNNMGVRDFVSTTWFLASGTNSAAFSMPFNFVGNWFDQTIGAGLSRTDLHSNFTPDLTTAPDTYFAYGGVYGGLYFGDTHSQSFSVTPSFEVTPVPEPATLLVLGGGALLAARRRKKS